MSGLSPNEGQELTREELSGSESLRQGATVEMERLGKERPGILKRGWNGLVKGADYATKPIRWLAKETLGHPIRTALIVLGGALIWQYYGDFLRHRFLSEAHLKAADAGRIDENRDIRNIAEHGGGHHSDAPPAPPARPAVRPDVGGQDSGYTEQHRPRIDPNQ